MKYRLCQQILKDVINYTKNIIFNMKQPDSR